MNITIWSVCNGDKYSDEDVRILQHMALSNIPAHYGARFRCLADRDIAGVDCLIPEEDWPGWWPKLLLFKYSSGLCLYFDLDVVITGPIDALVCKRLTMPANWGQSGHGGCQSSVMAWGQDYAWIPKYFRPEELAEDWSRWRGMWGDQEYITHYCGNPGEGVIDPMNYVYSYKYHCRPGGPPADARVVAFHGDPKPNEVSDPWVKQLRSIPT